MTGDGTLTFIYDQNNQLVEVEQGANLIAEYAYNGLGQRAIKTASGVTEVYHYDLDGKLIAESTLGGTFTKEYLYMGKVRVAMVDVVGGGTVYSYQNDRLGTPELLTTRIGDNETVVWEAWYEPFGEAHIHPSSSVVNNIRLPGQYYDAETGFHYNYHRYYDARTGRYTTPDPIRLAGGINLYAYVRGNPIRFIDLLGLVDLNLFDPSDPAFQGAEAAPSPPNTFTIAAHGNPTEIQDSLGRLWTPKQLATLIRSSRNFQPGMTIRLMSCNTGAYPGPGGVRFAEQLAYELCETVEAADNFCWFYSDGGSVVAPPNVPWITWQNATRAAMKSGPDRSREGGYVRFPF
jgi:RHS repeat-associated protein